MNNIVLAIIIVGAIGLLFGLLLAFAAIVFRVEVDERIEKIEELLPGANCGGCGYAGCSAYATAVVNDGAPVDACGAGGSRVAQQIGSIMGIAVGEKAALVAKVHCDGTCDKAKDKYEYHGIDDCLAASKFSGGQKACYSGCLGYGTCEKVCNFGAISIENGVARIDEDKCTACGMCVSACPKKLIELVPKDSKAFVMCNNHSTGKEVMAVCSAGCIACKICEKNCENGAISVLDNLAVIDYDKCTSCGVCKDKCPKKVITC